MNTFEKLDKESKITFLEIMKEMIGIIPDADYPNNYCGFCKSYHEACAIFGHFELPHKRDLSRLVDFRPKGLIDHLYWLPVNLNGTVKRRQLIDTAIERIKNGN